MSNSTVTIEGQYFDGSRPVGIAAKLIIAQEQAMFATTSLSLRFPVNQLRVSPRIAGTQRFIGLPTGAQFQCPDGPALDSLRQESTTEGVAAWLEGRVGFAVAAIAIVIALVMAGYFYGLPAAAERAARYIPIETEKTFGDNILSWLDENDWFAPSGIDDDLRVLVRQDFDELIDDLPLAKHYRLEFRASGFIGANAFALPGGIIVITDEMMNVAESLDEIAAVLAHEIGHVEHRHALRSLLQSSVIAIVVATVTSDAASLSVAVAGAPALLAQAKYSREFEAEADDFAFRRLIQTGRSPEAFASFMERLFDYGEGTVEDLSFLSTHPVTSERIARARRAASGE